MAQAQGARQQQSPFTQMLSTIARFVFMYYVMQWMRGGQQAGGGARPGASKDPAAYSHPKWSKGTLLDMYCFLSEKPHIRYYDDHMSDLVWSETGIPAAAGEPRQYSMVYEPSLVSLHH